MPLFDISIGRRRPEVIRNVFVPDIFGRENATTPSEALFRAIPGKINEGMPASIAKILIDRAVESGKYTPGDRIMLSHWLGQRSDAAELIQKITARVVKQ